VVDHPLGHIRGCNDVDGEHLQVIFERGVGKRAPGGDADIEHRDVDGPADALDELPEAFDTVLCPGVGLMAPRLDALASPLLGRLVGRVGGA
jgi:hypothetical protein